MSEPLSKESLKAIQERWTRELRTAVNAQKPRLNRVLTLVEIMIRLRKLES